MKPKIKPSAKPARESSVVIEPLAPFTAKPFEPKEPKVEAEHRKDVFVTAFMKTGNASEAARIAGYNPGSASKMMRAEEIQEALQEARGQLESATTITRMDVLELFMEAIAMARTMADPANMISGADKIAKMMGYYEPQKIQVEMTGNHAALQAKIKQLSDEDLYEMAYQRARTVQGEVLQ